MDTVQRSQLEYVFATFDSNFSSEMIQAAVQNLGYGIKEGTEPDPSGTYIEVPNGGSFICINILARRTTGVISAKPAKIK